MPPFADHDELVALKAELTKRIDDLEKGHELMREILKKLHPEPEEEPHLLRQT